MKRIYISGPISGIDSAVYLANFAERERTLRAQGFDEWQQLMKGKAGQQFKKAIEEETGKATE